MSVVRTQSEMWDGMSVQALEHTTEMIDRQVGHTEVGTTMRYLHVLTEDLQRPHESLSILNRMR